MRVLVTGGSGFIGRHVVARLSEAHEVLAPTHPELELTDAEAVRAWFAAHRVDAVVHAAVKPGHRNASDPTSLAYDNLRQFFALLRCRGAFGRFVVVGSGAAYGVHRPLCQVREEQLGLAVPEDEHGFSKYVEALELARDADAVELRPFGVFGPGEDYAIRFISNACCKALCGLPVSLRQDRRLSYVSVEDLAGVVILALSDRAGGGLAAGAYNVTPHAPASLLELAHEVVRVSGTDVPVVVGEPGTGLEYSGSGARLRREAPAFVPEPLWAGVERLYAWYEARRASIDRALLLTDR